MDISCRSVAVRVRLAAVARLMALALLLSATAAVNAQADRASSPIDTGCDAGGDGPETPSCGGPSESSDPGSAPAGNLPQSSVGNPISLFDGSKRQSEVDHAIPGSALVFKRVYDSATADYNVGVGQGWHHSYSVALFDAGNGAREIVQSDGSRLRFEPAGQDGSGFPLLRGLAPNHGHVLQVEDEHHWRLPDGRRLRFRGSFLVEIDWPDQRRLSLRYRHQKLAQVVDETGRVLRFQYSEGRRGLTGFERERFRPQPGTLSEVTLPDGSVIGYDYDEQKNLSRVRYPDETTREYHYEDARWPNHLTGVTDRTGVRFATWTYDAEGRAISSEHADGVEKVTLAYPDRQRAESGEVVETVVTNSLGAESVFTWQKPVGAERAQLLASSGSGCATCPATGHVYTYDESGRLSSRSGSGEGASTWQGSLQYGYDENGRISEVYRVDGLGGRSLVERREYEVDDLMPTRRYLPSINPGSERVTEIERNARQQPVRIVERGYAPVFATNPDGNEASRDRQPEQYRPIERVTSMTYDSKGRVIAFDGPRSDVDDITRFTWNEQSRLTAIHPPASPTLHFSDFDAQGLPIEFRQGERTPATLERDLSGNIETMQRGELTVRYQRDAEQRLLAVIDEDERRLQLSYDSAGRLFSVTDDLGRVTRLELDDESRRTRRVTYGRDGTTIRSIESTFDAWGRVSGVVTRAGEQDASPASAIEIAWGTDGPGAVLSEPLSGASAGVALDSLEGLIRTSQADGTELSTVLAGTARTVRTEDARGNVTLDPVDDFGRRVMSDSPDTGRVDFVHDAAGNRVEAQYEDGESMLFEYDAAGRLIARIDADSTSRWTWDESSDTLRSVTNGVTTERFDYDSDARMMRHVREIDGLTFQTEFDHDGRGRLVAKRLPDGQRLRYHYHDSGANRGTLRSIVRERWLGLGSETVVAEVDLDARDGESGYLSGNGLRTRRIFAPTGEIERIEIGDALALGYSFDDAGRIVAIEENGRENLYAYSRGRLVSASTQTGLYRYTYDTLGNRTGEMQSQPDSDPRVVRHAYSGEGQGNRLLESADAISRTSNRYRYDESGSMTTVGDLEYTYNASRRPTEVRRAGSLVAEYAYNAFGERVKKVVHVAGSQPVTTYFLYEGNAVAAEADELGNIDVQYLYLDGHRPIARLEGGEIHAIHTDHLGTPRLMTADDRNVVWQADYSPFGRAQVSVDRVDLRLRLPGHYDDAETGKHYNYLRDYDPETGRYLTADPMGLSGGLNLYAYVSASPLDASDPLGLFPLLAPSGEESDQLIARLMGMSADERRTYVETELDGFLDRSRFYDWAHEVIQTHPGATRTDWFQAASQVNGVGALGALDIPGSGLLYDDETMDYLEFAGLELGVHNLDTFLTMLDGGFVYDVCLAAPTEEERTEARSTMMVRYEQQALEQISADYFAGRPDGEQDAVYDDINALFNRDTIVDNAAMNMGSDLIEDAIEELFTSQGIRYDIGNIEHRIRLGEYMVEANRG